MVLVNKALAFMSGMALVVFAIVVPAGAAHATSGAEVGTVAVGSIPWGVAITPNGQTAYVTNTSVSGTVSVIDIPTRTLTTTISVGSRPYGVAFTPDGTKAYVANRDSDSVSVINVATSSVIATVPVGDTPYGVTVSLDGTKVYVANNVSDNVSVISTATQTVIATITIPQINFSSPDPLWIATNPVSGEIYVTGQDLGLVKIVDTAVSGSPLNVSSAYSLSVTPDGSQIYVTTSAQSGTIIVVSTSSFTQTGTIPNAGGNIFFGIGFAPNGQYAFVSNSNLHTLNRVDLATQSLSPGNGFPVALSENDPNNVAITPDCTMALVVTANYPSGPGNGYLTFVSTGIPNCPPPVPSPTPTPTPTPTLASTGSQGIELFVASMLFLAVGFMLYTRRRTVTN